MKKILSFMLLLALLMGCLAPCAFAVEGPAIVAESVEKLQGADKNVNARITLENNPGTYSMQLIVFYDSSELALGDSESAFANSLFGADDSTIGTELAGTNTKIRNYISSEKRSTSRGFIIDLYGTYDPSLEDTAVVYGDGVVVSIPFEIIGDEFRDYNYTVVVAEACDENGDELEVAGSIGTVTYVKDQYVDIFDEFTVFMTPEELDIKPDVGTVDVDIRFDQNPGLWATRVFIVYPEELTLNNGSGVANVDNNTGIFLSNADLITGFPDLELDDERQVQAFQDIMKKNPSIVKEGYHSTTLYFERQDSYDEAYTGNGVLCTLHFNVDPSVEIGKELDIKLYYGEADFLYADTDPETLEPIFVNYWPTVYGSDLVVTDCYHTDTTTGYIEPTCTVDGYDGTFCNQCNRVIAGEKLPALNHPERIKEGEVSASCIADGYTGDVVCTVCGNTLEYGEVIPMGDHVSEMPENTVDISPTCTEDGRYAQYCDSCGTLIREDILAALGHDIVITGEVSVTCTENGYTGDTVCSICGETLIAGEVISASGHGETVVVGAVEPTVTKNGYTGDTVCSVCEEVLEAGEVIPAIEISGSVLAVDTVEKLQGSDNSVSSEVAVINNPGTYSMTLVVYYDASELKLGDTEGVFANSLFGADDSTIGTELAGTNTKIRNYIPSDLRSTSRGFIIDLYGVYDENSEDTAVVYGDGVVVSIPFEILASEAGDYNYTVVVAEAYDENGEEYDLTGTVGTISYIADPYIGIYDDFTVFFTPEEAEIDLETGTIDVDIRLDNNPGLWATRVYIVYPEGLSLDNGSGSANVDNNTGIFLSKSDSITGIPDLDLTDERQVQGFKELMAADPSIVRDGYVSTTLYFERQDSYDEVYTNSGVLCTLHFTVDPSVEPGTELDLALYYGEADFLFADTDDSTGEPIFISYWPDVMSAKYTVTGEAFVCDHAETTIVGAVEPTATKDGYTGDTVCNACGEVIEAGETIPAIGFTEPSIVAEDVTKAYGADKNVNADLLLYNNPGTHSMKLVVYYNSSELALGDSESAFANSLFGADDSTIGTELAGTNHRIRNYIPSDLRSTSKGFIIDLYGEYVDELEDTAVVYDDGVVVSIPFEIIGDEFRDYNYTVVVAEAYDENGEELELAGTVGTISYIADPYIGIYDDFTVFFTPENAEIKPDAGTIDVDIRLDNNPGLWATRVYIVYPEGLSLDNGFGSANVDNNTGIFLGNADLITGFPDLELDDERQVQAFQDIMKENPSIVKEGYHSTTLYFERQDSYEEVYTNSGVLCTLHFTVDPSVEPGTELDLALYYGEADFLFADTDDSTGNPIFISYWPTVVGSTITVAECEHANTTVESADVTCTVDGYERTVCTDCGTIIEETITPAQGHTTLQPGSTVTITPTCTEPGSQTRYCDVCGEINSYEEIPAYGHDYDGGTEVIDEPTCTTAGVEVTYCDFCGEVSKIEEIPALNHPEEYRELTGAVEPTQTMDGYTGDIVCSLCGETIEAGEIIPALGMEENFKVYTRPTVTNVVYGGDSIDIDIVFENNPGIWAGRLFIAYPDALTLDNGSGTPNIENSFNIFPGSSDMVFGYADIALDDERQVSAFKKIITEQALTVDGYHSTTVYFELSRYDDTTYENGVLCTLHFNVDSGVTPSDILDIRLYYAEGDFIWAGTDETTGNPLFITYSPEVLGTDIYVSGECVHTNITKVHKDAGCVENGYDRTVCIDCGTIIEETILPGAGGHTTLQPGSTVTIAPTCTEPGSQTRYCDVCGEINSYEELPAYGHDYDGGTEVTVKPTCTTAGIEVTYCDFCGEISKTREISATGHLETTLTGAVDATCTEDGYTGDEICDACGETAVAGETIPALNHPSTSIIGVKAPTETTDGYTGDTVCDLCGTVCVAGEIIPAYSTGDRFTVYAKPEVSELIPGTQTVDVDIMFANNPGLWSTRIYIVYPEELTLSDGSAAQIYNSGEIFAGETDMISGIPDLALNDSRQVTAFKNLMKADPSIMREGYHSTTVYFETAYIDTVITANGVLCTLRFNVDPGVDITDILDIKIYYGEYDFLQVETDASGFPIFTSLEPVIYGTNIRVFCDHSEVTTGYTAPTCTEEGYNGSVCAICGEILSGEVIPAMGHHEGEPVIVEPTCEEDGSYDIYCDRCGESLVTEVLPSYGHEEGDPVIVEPTCVDSGSITYYCEICGCILESEEIPSAGIHTYLSEGSITVVEPSCLEGGYTVKKCDICGDTTVTDYTDPTDHKTDGEIITIDPTCTGRGYIIQNCPDCSYSWIIETIPALPHTEEESDRVDATCTEEGRITYVCSQCGEVTREDIIPVTDHVYESEGSVVVIAPTCTENGYTVKTCDCCGYTETVDIVETTGHVGDVKTMVIPSTCTSYGYEITSCSVCGEIISTITLPMAAHSYKDTIVPPTKTEEGYTLHTCTVCGESYKDNFKDPIGGSDTEGVYGDFDGDGNVNVKDINISKRLVSGSVTPSLNQTIFGDVNGDGKINGLDANILSRYVSGNITEL